MYYAIVAVLMFLLPLASIAVESMIAAIAVNASLIAKWFVFWAVGWRLLLAGVKQIAQPQYTAREILGLKSDESLILVRELGFANVAIGLLGVLSLFQPGWQLGAALRAVCSTGSLGSTMHAKRIEIGLRTSQWCPISLPPRCCLGLALSLSLPVESSVKSAA